MDHHANPPIGNPGNMRVMSRSGQGDLYFLSDLVYSIVS